MAPDLNILSDPTRRAILALLATEPELCVCEVEAALDQVQPVVSRHFALLRDGGWVVGRREGRRIYYRVSRLPDWARLIVRAYADGGVPKADLQAALARLARFEGRPSRLTRSAP